MTDEERTVAVMTNGLALAALCLAATEPSATIMGNATAGLINVCTDMNVEIGTLRKLVESFCDPTPHERVP